MEKVSGQKIKEKRIEDKKTEDLVRSGKISYKEALNRDPLTSHEGLYYDQK